jgi:hypothetical protein
MSNIGSLLKKLWSEEPVLVAAAAALAVTEGILTNSQASGITDLITGVLQTLAAFGIRTQVTSPANLPPTN